MKLNKTFMPKLFWGGFKEENRHIFQNIKKYISKSFFLNLFRIDMMSTYFYINAQYSGVTCSGRWTHTYVIMSNLI